MPTRRVPLSRTQLRDVTTPHRPSKKGARTDQFDEHGEARRGVRQEANANAQGTFLSRTQPRDVTRQDEWFPELWRFDAQAQGSAER